MTVNEMARSPCSQSLCSIVGRQMIKGETIMIVIIITISRSYKHFEEGGTGQSGWRWGADALAVWS